MAVRLLIAASLGVVGMVSPLAVGQTTYVFDPAQSSSGGTDGSGTWDTGMIPDWYNATAGSGATPWSNSAADTAQFGSGGTAGTVSVANGVNVGTIQFSPVSSGNYTLSGGSLNLGAPGGAGMINVSAGLSPTINTPITTGATDSGATFDQTGTGTLNLNGANTFTGFASVDSGTMVLSGGVTDSFNNQIAVGSSLSPAGSAATPNSAVMTIASGTTVNANNQNVGLGNSDNNGNGTASQALQLNVNGTLNAGFLFTTYNTAANTTATINIASGAVVNAGAMSFNQSAGTTTNVNLTGKLILSNQSDFTAGNANTTTNFIMNAGSQLTDPGYFYLTYNSGGVATQTAVVTQNGGTFYCGSGSTTNGLFFGYGTGTYNLNGGVLSALNVGTANQTPNSGSSFNFNGGTLQAANGGGGLGAGFFSPPAATVGANGGTIDTQANSVTAGTAITSAVASPGIDGGITKIGSGSLSMTGACTYTGPTKLNAGTLTIDTTRGSGMAALANTQSISVAGGTELQLISATGTNTTMINPNATIYVSDSGGAPNLQLDLNNPSASQTVFALIYDGAVQPAGVYSNSTEPSGATIPMSYFNANGSDADFGGELNVTTAPEPGSISMLVLGGVALMRRKRHPARTGAI